MLPIDYVCFTNHSGYAQGALDMIAAMDQTGNYDIRISCLHRTPDRNSFTKSYFNKLYHMSRRAEFKDPIQILQCIPDMHRKIKKHKRSIGFGIYETFDPPKHWIPLLNRMDAVICPSHFAYKQFAQSGISRPIFYIPHGFDTKLWNPEVKPMYERDRFTFLFVGTWRRRKGVMQLFEAWFKEFGNYDNVQIVVKTDKVGIAKKEIDRIRTNLGISASSTAPVVFENKIFSEVDLPSFYKSSDCLVLPTLGEGFGLPPMQCMAMKIPVIVTNFSGCQEYASEDTCTLLEPKGFLMHEYIDKIPQFKGRKWPRITVESIQEAMRHVLDNSNEVAQKSEKAYDLVINKFNYEKISTSIQEMMETVYGADIFQT